MAKICPVKSNLKNIFYHFANGQVDELEAGVTFKGKVGEERSPSKCTVLLCKFNIIVLVSIC